MEIETGGDAGERELLRSYSRLDESYSEVERPADVAELSQLLIDAKGAGRRVSFRAGGMSLHDQSLNDDLVISLERFDDIGELDVERQIVTVGAGATWGDIVAATLPHQLVPYVVVTSKRCSCGGTLASDGISRYSPSFGSESTHVESFEFLEVGAALPRTIVKPSPDDDSSDDAKLFRAVIGGFGYLGVVTRITYRLLSVAHVGRSPGGTSEPDKLMVSTKLFARTTFRELVETQISLLEEPIEDDLETWLFPRNADPEAYPSVYTVAFPGGRGAVYKSTYSRGQQGEPYIIYRPGWWVRIVLGVLLTWRWLKPIVNAAVWHSMSTDSERQTVFVNDVEDYMFFMDGDVATKRFVEERMGKTSPVLQQTFVVPYLRAADFMDEMSAILDEHEVVPTLFEFLFMPRDRILMSASYDMPGFAVTLAFQDIANPEHTQEAIAVIEVISRMCHDSFGGRIHFTKCVYAPPEVVRAMYAGRSDEFLALKQRYDPQSVLRNEFFERIFPA